MTLITLIVAILAAGIGGAIFSKKYIIPVPCGSEKVSAFEFFPPESRLETIGMVASAIALVVAIFYFSEHPIISTFCAFCAFFAAIMLHLLHNEYEEVAD